MFAGSILKRKSLIPHLYDGPPVDYKWLKPMSDNSNLFETLYGELVLNNRSVCSNCFRRNADRIRITHKAAWTTPYADGPVELKEHKKHDRFDYHFETTSDAIGGTCAARLRETKACTCGVVNSWMRLRPVDKDTAYDMVERLVDRVTEEIVNLAADTSFDENAMWQCFKDLKTDPDEQFADDRIFAKSVDAAVTIESDIQKQPVEA